VTGASWTGEACGLVGLSAAQRRPSCGHGASSPRYLPERPPTRAALGLLHRHLLSPLPSRPPLSHLLPAVPTPSRVCRRARSGAAPMSCCC